MRARFCAMFLLVGGCNSTSLLLTVDDPSHALPVQALRVTAFAQGRLGGPHTVSLGGQPLPGKIGITPLDATLGYDFRVLVDALDGSGKLVGQGARRIPLKPNQVNYATVELSPGVLPDSSGYGVPDVIDDCPGGDDNQPVCMMHPIGGVGVDLAGADLAGGADMAGNPPIDMQVPFIPPDLAMLSDLRGPSPPDLTMPPDLRPVFDLTPPADLRPPPPDLTTQLGCPPSAFACDGFESGGFASPPWDPASAGSLVTVGTQNPHLGKFAASVRFVANQGTFESRKISVGPLSSGQVGIRAFAMFASKPSDTDYFLELGTTGLRIGSAPGTGGFVWAVDNANTSQLDTSSSVVPGHTYQCVELLYDLGTLEVQMWIDGAAVLDTFESTAPPPPGIDGLFLGALSVASVNNTVFVDDVAIGSGRLGCN